MCVFRILIYEDNIKQIQKQYQQQYGKHKTTDIGKREVEKRRSVIPNIFIYKTLHHTIKQTQRRKTLSVNVQRYMCLTF